MVWIIAQNAAEDESSIGFTFALVGLYLHVERGFTGRQVQQVHMQLAKHQLQWPAFRIPQDRGEVTATHVLQASEGPNRDQMIHLWCTSVWEAFSDNRELVASLLQSCGI